MALELVQSFFLGPAPFVGGPQVVDRQLGQADPQRRGVGQAPVRVGAQRLGGPRVAAEGVAVLAVRVDDQEAVAAVGGHHAGAEDLQEVGLAHAGGGEDANVAGEAPARDAHLEIDHRLAAAQVADGQVTHALGKEGEVLGRRRDHTGELGREALRFAEDRPRGAGRRRRCQVAEAPALGQPVGPLGLLVEGVSAAFAPGVVGQQGAGNPLGPTRFAVLGAVAHVHDPEQVAPPGRLVHSDEQLAEEQVLFGGGPEQRFEHIAPEEPSPCVRRRVGHRRLAVRERPSSMPLSIALASALRPRQHAAHVSTALMSARRSRKHAAQDRSMRAWRSAKARSLTSSRQPGRVEGALQFGPHLLARPARAGGQAVGDRERVGVTRETGVVGQGAQLPKEPSGIGIRLAGRCGRRTGRRGRGGRRRRASPGRPRGGARRQAPTSRRAAQGRPLLRAPAGRRAGRRPGRGSCAWSLPPGRHCVPRPCEQVGEPMSRDPPVGLEVAVHQDYRPGLRLLHARRHEAPLGPVAKQVEVDGSARGRGGTHFGQ